MTIQVPGCRILIRPVKVEETDKALKAAKQAGLFIPELSERKQQAAIDKGTVLQIGPTVNEDFTEGLSVGDCIGFTKYGGKFVTDPETEETLLIINDEDVICIFKGK